jgi:hypothetical protein
LRLPFVIVIRLPRDDLPNPHRPVPRAGRNVVVRPPAVWGPGDGGEWGLVGRGGEGEDEGGEGVEVDYLSVSFSRVGFFDE